MYKGNEETLTRLMPDYPESTRFTVVCRRKDYSAGRIARAVEDCDAHVLNLNVTSDNVGEDMVCVDVRIDRTDASSIVRSLERYDYLVTGFEDIERVVSDSERQRVAEVLRYLEL
ncbi:MAG: hypothetical protein J1F20_07440 [Muribaculaceae bacterium]|nr:hypothetical protein [Muribaculaceae bacterium]